jgi:hypothetical protein
MDIPISEIDLARPNELRISRRKRQNCTQNGNDLVRAAVGCMRLLGGCLMKLSFQGRKKMTVMQLLEAESLPTNLPPKPECLLGQAGRMCAICIANPIAILINPCCKPLGHFLMCLRDVRDALP